LPDFGLADTTAEDKQKVREAGLEYLVKNHVDNVDIKTLDVVKKRRRVK